jgi:phenylacetate-CoA ligase
MLGVYAPIPVSVFNDVTTQVSIIEEMKPDILDGYSSSLFLLAKEVEKRGLEKIRPRFIISGAELIDDSSLKYIGKTFDAPVYDQYACIEMERIAWQCPRKMGYHMDVDTVIVQFVDENGEEVSNGERGEIVCTSLFNFAMPLIRYAVGDIGVSSDEHCSCGRTLPLMKVVEGRKDSLLLLPDGRVISPRAFSIAISMFRLYRYIEQFRVIQRKTGSFEILIKADNSAGDEKTIEIELVSHIKRMLGLEECEVTFDVRFVDEIRLDDSGKFRLIVSELSRERLE